MYIGSCAVSSTGTFSNFEIASLLQVISIYGQPENCTKACKEILQVMEHEAVANVRG